MKILIIGNSDSTADTSWDFNVLKNICNNYDLEIINFNHEKFNDQIIKAEQEYVLLKLFVDYFYKYLRRIEYFLNKKIKYQCLVIIKIFIKLINIYPRAPPKIYIS